MPQRSSTTPTSLIPARARGDLVTREVLEMAGGREALEEALELVGADPHGTNPTDVMLSRLRDPAFAGHSLTEMAKASGLTRIELYDLLGKRDTALAIFMSRRRHLHDVLEDIGEDAKSTVINCKGCGGSGEIPPSADAIRLQEAEIEHLRSMNINIDPQPLEATVCEDCNGLGKLRKIGDADARKLFLKVHGLDKSGAGGPTINNLNVGVQVKNDNRSANQPEPVTVKVERYLDGG